VTEIFRQAASSRIITTAHQINCGEMPDLGRAEANSDFHFVVAEDPESAAARILELVQTRIPRGFGLDPVRDIQVLCPMARGGVGSSSKPRICAGASPTRNALPGSPIWPTRRSAEANCGALPGAGMSAADHRAALRERLAATRASLAEMLSPDGYCPIAAVHRVEPTSH
jgi:hypothetical protein